MSFSNEWEDVYSQGGHNTVWPWSNVVSHVYRFARPEGENFRILELGCGPGANIPFFRSLNADYRAMDGSDSAIEAVVQKEPGLKDSLCVGDFTREIPFEGMFDLVIERASITHNSTEDIKSCLKLVENKLKPSGIFIGLDWFSTEHTDFANGEQLEDPFTRGGYDENSGPFANSGAVHFSDQGHLQELFSNFQINSLQHNIRRHVFPVEGYQIATWDIVAQKNAGDFS